MESLRRPLALKARVDLATFYIPHRHVDDNFEELVKQGIDAGVALSTDSSSLQRPVLPYWTQYPVAKAKWYVQGYLNCYNRFFRPRAQTTSDATWATGPWSTAISDDDARFGFPAAALPTAIHNQTVDRDLDNADLEITLGATLELPEIQEKQARFVTERHRQFRDVFYQNVISRLGGSTTIDAEPRPEKIWHDSYFMGGQNIEGYDNQTIGVQGGRHFGKFNHRIPRRYIPEPGAIWTMGVVRYPFVSPEEHLYLISNQTYEDIVGDPDVARNTRPVDLKMSDVFDTTDSTVIQKTPHSHWYRSQPNFSHPDYKGQRGFTFAQDVPSVDLGEGFYNVALDDENFVSTRYGHGMVMVTHDINANRSLPPMEESIYAGAHL